MALQAVVVAIPPPVHHYSFDNDYSDAGGGPLLQSFGGSIGDGRYHFGPDQGLLLSAPSISTSTYTIEISFSFDTLSGYSRIFDVKNRASDTGLYALQQSLNFYNVANSSSIDFTAGESVNVVLTRLGSSQEMVGYVNGQQVFTFFDTGGLGEISGPNKELYFFMDDLAVVGESKSGSVDFIRVFNQALDASQVLELYQNGAPLAVPEPSTWALMITGVAILGVGYYRRKRNAA